MSYYPNRKRPHHIQVWLDDMEYQRLNIMTAYTNQSREQVLRSLINGLQIKEAPQLEFFDILDKLSRAGNNLNQIAVTLRTYGFMDEPKLDEAMKIIRNIQSIIYDGFKPDK